MIMAFSVNLNADVGEGWGAYQLGDDAGMLDVVTSVSIACGFHAGDPVTMHRVVSLAKEKGVSIGAHPSFNDRWGFGRRPITMQPDELEYMVAYQIGALQALAAYVDIKVTHLKPHGALYNMAAVDRNYATAIGRAIKSVDRSLIYVVLTNSEMEKAGRELGLRVAREGFCDRRYEDDGNLTSRNQPDAMIKDPAEAVQQVLGMVTKGELLSRTGKVVKASVDTVCLHGDEPHAAAMARQVRAGLEAAGISILPLPAMNLS
jgi:UPF0271 protein